MITIYRHLEYLIIISLYFIVVSCKGQINSISNKSSLDTQALTVFESLGMNKLSNNIMSIFHDSHNNYWFGSWKDGLYCFDGKKIIHYNQEDGLPSNRVEEIREDKRGNIFINTSEGVCKFDGRRFVKLLESYTFLNQWMLKPDDLWFKCTQQKGSVYRYDGSLLYRLKLPKVSIGEEFIKKNNSSLSPYDVYCVYKDSRNNIWFGTAAIGACRFDGNTIDWILEDDVTELHNGPSNGVRSIIEDKNGYFWFNSNYRYSVYRTPNTKDSVNQKFYVREQGIGNLDGKNDSNLNEYLSIAKDSLNDLWIVTYLNGVWHYNGKETTHYSIKEGSNSIKLFYIYKDNFGTLWLGTQEHGVYKFNGKSFEKFRFPND